MKKKISIFVGIISVLLFISIFTQMFFNNYYKNLFSANTWINDVYCTGKSIDEVNKALIANSTVPSIDIVLVDGTVYSYELSADEYEVNYQSALKSIKDKQNNNLTQEEIYNHNIEPDYFFKENKIIESVSNLDFISQQDACDKKGLFIQFESNKYVLHDCTKNVFDKEKAISEIKEAIIQQKNAVSMNDFYYDLVITDEMSEVINTYKKIEDFNKFYCEYEFGEEIEVIDASVVVDFILTDDNQNVLLQNDELIINENAVRKYIQFLSEKYDTYNVERQFLSYERGVVTIPGGTYGNKIDVEKEVTYLINALKDYSEPLKRIPEYTEKALYQGKDDIGPNYVEIDMTSQMLYVFEDKQMIFSTPVVTGNLSENDGTPEAVCYVAGKYRNRILKGADYETPVKYWVPVYKSKIGIHDASWRKKSEFKPETYLQHGSHGCINVQSSVMPDLYKLLFKGMPVIMHY